jgi:hypothetical protein
MSTHGKSGQQKGADNVERLQAYIASIEAEGGALPMRGGNVNMSAIALACGFDRNVLYTNEAAGQALKEAVDRQGRMMPDQHGRATLDLDPDATAKTDPRDRRILQLEQANVSLKAENGELRAERTRLREQLRRYEHIEAHMVETGRRVAS